MIGNYDYSFFQWDIVLEMISVEMMLSFSGSQGNSIFLKLTDQRAQNQRISGLERTATEDFMNILSYRELTAFQADFPSLVNSEI